MGYELHIVRQNNYDNGEELSNISLDEWLSYVATDQERELTPNGHESPLPGIETIWQERPGFCYWHGHPRSGAGTLVWFDYGYGEISTKYRDEHTIKKND